MPRKKKRETEVAVTTPETDDMFTAMYTQAQAKLGGEYSVGTLAEGLVGLPLPALCLRYLLQLTVFPLSRIWQLVGEEGSCKSALLYEIFRWHIVCNGGAVLAENENKDAESLRKAVMRWYDPWIRRIVTKPTFALEDWQDVLTSYTVAARAQQDIRGRTTPICFGVDSLMATAPRSEIADTLKDGHSSRGFALGANLISRYMRTMPAHLRNYPFSVVGTNHLKPSTTPTGLPTSTIPGGKSVKFMETFEIEMKKAPVGANIDLADYGGLRVTMETKKNSLGPSRRKITAEFLWWWEQIPGGALQHASWDWNAATVELLLSFHNLPGKKKLANRLTDITGIQKHGDKRQAYSDVLGIPKTDPQHFRIVGAALEQRPDLLTQLYAELGITVCAELIPGVDYAASVAEATRIAQLQMQQRVAAGEQPEALTVDTDEIDMSEEGMHV